MKFKTTIIIYYNLNQYMCNVSYVIIYIIQPIKEWCNTIWILENYNNNNNNRWLNDYNNNSNYNVIIIIINSINNNRW